MTREDLTAALETLHRELANSQNLDSEDLAHLKATADEIRAVLDPKKDDSDSLTGRVSASAKQFEESHPVLTESLGRIADILQQMGI